MPDDRSEPARTAAVISVSALTLAVLVSCVSRLNVGVLSIAMAWIVGVYVGGLPVDDAMAGFPGPLSDARRRDVAVRHGAVQRHPVAASYNAALVPGTIPKWIRVIRRGDVFTGATRRRDLAR